MLNINYGGKWIKCINIYIYTYCSKTKDFALSKQTAYSSFAIKPFIIRSSSEIDGKIALHTFWLQFFPNRVNKKFLIKKIFSPFYAPPISWKENILDSWYYTVTESNERAAYSTINRRNQGGLDRYSNWPCPPLGDNLAGAHVSPLRFHTLGPKLRLLIGRDVKAVCVPLLASPRTTRVAQSSLLPSLGESRNKMARIDDVIEREYNVNRDKNGFLSIAM